MFIVSGVTFSPLLRFEQVLYVTCVFLHVYPNEANEMSTCSSCYALHVDCFSLHDIYHLAMFISFAKWYVAVMSLNLLRDAS